MNRISGVILALQTTLLLFNSTSLWAVSNPAPVTLDVTAFRQQMQQVAPATLKRPAFGGVVAIAQQGRVLFWYGKAPLTLQSQFILASQSKQFTATLVLQAVDQGLFSLDTPVAQFFPERQALYQFPAGPVLTVRHLLEHSSGLDAVDEAVTFAAGSQFSYSNANYDLLGEILTKVYQSPYANLAEQLFNRCQLLTMQAPTAQRPTSQITGLVAGWREDTNGQLQRANVDTTQAWLPSGRLVGSVGDLLKFQHCVHQQGILTAQAHQMMVQPQQHRSHRWGELGYALGLQINQQDDLQEWSHSGYVDGYISTTLYYPDFAVGAVLLEPLSLDSSRPERAFFYHDALRQALRQQLIQNRRTKQ